MKKKLLCFIFLVPRPALVAVTFNPLSCFCSFLLVLSWLSSYNWFILLFLIYQSQMFPINFFFARKDFTHFLQTFFLPPNTFVSFFLVPLLITFAILGNRSKFSFFLQQVWTESFDFLPCQKRILASLPFLGPLLTNFTFRFLSLVLLFIVNIGQIYILVIQKYILCFIS